MDLPKRLREHDYEWSPQNAKALGAEAAAEIERLRDALAAVKDCIEDKNYIDADMIIDNALQQKDSE